MCRSGRAGAGGGMMSHSMVTGALRKLVHLAQGGNNLLGICSSLPCDHAVHKIQLREIVRIHATKPMSALPHTTKRLKRVKSALTTGLPINKNTNAPPILQQSA